MEGPSTGHDTGEDDDELDSAAGAGRYGSEESMDVFGHVGESVRAGESGAGRNGDTSVPDATHSPLGQHSVPDGHMGEL